MQQDYQKIITQNRKAKFNYFITEKIEAGIVLKGTELKALRQGKVSIEDSYAASNGKEIFLYNAYIAEYDKAHRFNHSTRRLRKLLLHKKEIQKITGIIKTKGYTLVALSLYFNSKNKAKVELGIVKGKKQYDKRQSIKDRDWKREQAQIIRNKF